MVKLGNFFPYNFFIYVLKPRKKFVTKFFSACGFFTQFQSLVETIFFSLLSEELMGNNKKNFPPHIGDPQDGRGYVGSF